MIQRLIIFVILVFFWTSPAHSQNRIRRLYGEWELEKYDFRDFNSDSVPIKQRLVHVHLFFDSTGVVTGRKPSVSGLKFLGKSEYSLNENENFIYQDDQRAEILALNDTVLKIQTQNKLILIYRRVTLRNNFSLSDSSSALAIRIVEAQTGKPVPYASVTGRGGIGYTANDSGIVFLNENINDTDNLTISAIGFRTEKLTYKNLLATRVIGLEIQENVLEAVKPMISVPKTLNPFSKCKGHDFMSDGSMKQIAVFFTNPKAFSKLNGVDLCVSNKDSRFKINVYQCDSVTGGPGKLIADTLINFSGNKSLFHIDFSRRELFIDGNFFFVAVEWLMLKENEIIKTMGPANRKINKYFYAPVLKANSRSYDSAPPYWIMLKSGEWFKNDLQYGKLLLSVTLR